MIGLFLVAIGAFLIGLVIGYSWGENSGYQDGYNQGRTIVNPFRKLPDTALFERSGKMQRLQCSRDVYIPRDCPPAQLDDIKVETSAQLAKDLAKTLMTHEKIQPVVLDGDIRTYHHILRVGISLYVAADPTFETYQPLRSFFP